MNQIPRIVFGFHGCDESVVQMVLKGGSLNPSTNEWDWLGHGVYFWEDSAARALHWAEEMSRQPGSRVKSPAVLGAIINPGHCLNLTEPESSGLVRQAYEEHLQICRMTGTAVAENKGPESKARFLDCAVMNLLHELNQDAGLPAYDTVRGFFVEGRPLYPTAGLRTLDHVQVCVRRTNQIVGFFRPNVSLK
jgi:hypothetical protein